MRGIRAAARFLRRSPGRRGRRRAPSDDDAAVSDVVGSIMMVAITVVTAGAFGALLLAFDGPENQLYVSLEMRTDPGANGWESGDERVLLIHMGGEAVDAELTTISFTADGTRYTYSGGDLGSDFADDGDGRLTIGETWESPALALLNLAQDEAVQADVVTGTTRASRVVLSGTVTGGGILLSSGGGGPTCSPDTANPTGVLTVPDITIATLGAVTITLSVSDNCGVSTLVNPSLFVCATTDFVFPDSGTVMPHISGNQFATTVSRTWALLGGHTLYLYVTGFQDSSGNTGTTATSTQLIDGASTYSYGGTPAIGVGSVTTPSAARASCDAAAAAFAEGFVSAVSTFSGATTADSGALQPTRALGEDDVRATLDTQGEYVEVSGFNLPADATGIRTVLVGIEARFASGLGSAPQGRVDYRVGGGTLSQGLATVLTSSDASYTRTLTDSRAWTVADVEALVVRATNAVDTSTRNMEVDHIYIQITYATTSGAVRALTSTIDWSGVPAAATHTMELRYTSAGDTFTLQLWDGSAFNTRSFATSTCDAKTCASVLMTAGEYNGGAPRLRILDDTPAGATQGTLDLEYARVRNT